ncbi:MAG: hypothetical protein RLZZ399_1342 [Verrucomicrobiota bacterium]|jgi:hypothetical protein
MVGVAVLGLVIYSVFRLVGTQLTALEVSRVSQTESTINEGVERYVQGVLMDLPPKQLNVFRGLPHLVGQDSADEMQWVARPGFALLTSAAADSDHALTLTLQPSKWALGKQDLALGRRLLNEPENRTEWIPLVAGVVSLRFRYFHPALQTWLDRWDDPINRPALVQMRLGRRVGEEPIEVVFFVPASRVQ